MLANQFSAPALPGSLGDALRTASPHGALPLHARPYVCRDALNLPSATAPSFVMACQMLSQFMDIESVFVEVKRVLAPAACFFSWRSRCAGCSPCAYTAASTRTHEALERKLFDWACWLPGARRHRGREEESFGIRQNHTMYLKDWHRLVTRHFTEHRYQAFVRSAAGASV